MIPLKCLRRVNVKKVFCLIHDLKQSMCKNGLYVGKNKGAYKGLCAKKGLDD